MAWEKWWKVVQVVDPATVIHVGDLKESHGS